MPAQDVWIPHTIPTVQAVSRNALAPGSVELSVASYAETAKAALVDPGAVILSVNDGSGWREPLRQLPAGWSLDTYRIKSAKPRTVTRGAGRDAAGRNCYYIHLAPAETPEQAEARRASWRKTARR